MGNYGVFVFFTKFNDLINLSRISRSYSLFCFWFKNIVALLILRTSFDLSHTVQLALRDRDK